MKKPIAIVALGVLALAGCAGRDTSAEGAPTTTVESPRPAPPQAAIGNPIDIMSSKDFTTVTASDWRAAPDVSPTAFKVTFLFEQKGGSYFVDAQYLGLRTTDGSRIDPITSSSATTLRTYTLPDGEKTKGDVVYEVPSGATPDELVLWSTVDGPRAIWNLR